MINPGRHLLLSHVTEAEWLVQVKIWANRAGFLVYHTRDSRGSEAGFPDLFLVHPVTGRKMCVELKTMGGRLRREQEIWRNALVLSGIPYHLWRPDMEDEVKRELGVVP